MRISCFKLSRVISLLIDKILEEIHDLPDVEKQQLLDVILTDLDKLDPGIDQVWAEEGRKRWAAYKASKIPAESVMAKHRRT
jgi:Putative addiction module component